MTSERVATKVCGTCRVLVSVDGFYRQTASFDGLQGRCKSCVKAHNASPQGKAVRKAAAASPHRKATKAAYNALPQWVAYRTAYYALSQNKSQKAAAAASPHRKATKAAYNFSPQGRARNSAYNALPQSKANRKAYVTSPQGKAALRTGVEKWRVGNPKKIAAHKSVSNALRRGELVRPSSCSACENTERLQAHHDNYERPLDVRWLCQPCHSAHHVAVRQAANLLFSKETHHDL